MNPPIPGLHHVTAISSDPQKLLDFYGRVLGLRLVKKTVNFDDPASYHFYFGDGLGRPGTIVTFFAWPGAARGRRGNGQVTTIALSAPTGSLGYWAERLRSKGIEPSGPHRRFDEEWLGFYDFDGLALEIVAGPGKPSGEPWQTPEIPIEHALRGIAGVVLAEEGFESTGALLSGDMGFAAERDQGNRYRFAAGGGGGGWVDVLCMPDGPRGRVACGTVHHVAFRVSDDVAQETWRRRLAELGYNVSPVLDRQYFHSIYFREPGGILFELATDPPGFAVDESAETLGSALKLPPQLESLRAGIEQALPRIR